jgi:hypothetical protein
MTSPQYDGDNPLRLANEIDAALAKYGLGNDHRMCKAIHFFEAELRLIAECLRCAGPQKVAKQPPGSTRPGYRHLSLPQSSSASRFTAGHDVAEVRGLGFAGAWVKHSPPKRLRNASAMAASGKQK